MTRILFGLFAAGVLALTGCDKNTSTAPSTDPNKPNEVRELTLVAPPGQTIEKNKTEKFTVTVNRKNFDGPVVVEIRDLPKGVSLVTDKLEIPAGQNTLEVSVKADANATPVNDHKVTVLARGKDQKDMKEANVQFEMDVK